MQKYVIRGVRCKICLVSLTTTWFNMGNIHYLSYIEIFFKAFVLTRRETIFQNICCFFQEATFFTIFQGVSSTNRYSFSQKPLFSLRKHTNFQGASIFSSNRYSFSRKPYLVLEHILFSRRHLWLEQIGVFQEGTPRRTTDISLIRLAGCFWGVKKNKNSFGYVLHLRVE